MCSLNDAVSCIQDGMIIGLSGFSYQNPPMAIVRELINQKKNNLTIVSGPTSGIETDMLIGAGCVKKVISAGVSFEKISGIAPNFRAAVENNSIELWECDETIWHVALQAGIDNKEYINWPAPVGTSITDLNKDLVEFEKDGKHFLKIPAIKLDLAIVHVGFSDYDGNLAFPEHLFRGRMFCEKKLVMNAKHTIASVEKITSRLPSNKEVHIGKADFVVEAEFGAHPGASNGFYVPDVDHYQEYIKYCKENKFSDYLKKYVLGVNFSSYINKFTTISSQQLKIKEND